MDNVKPPKKPLIFYYILAMVAILLLNMLVMPMVSRASVQEASYSQFLQQLQEGEVGQIEIQEDRIVYVTLKTDEKRPMFYVTGMMEDSNQLAQRLEQYPDVTYGKVIPQKENTFLSALLSWVFPIVLMVVLGQVIMRTLSKKIGGPNAMSFGKSNAKVYVAAQSGKTFLDVAGQDEAKDALKEIVDFLHNPQKYKDIGARLPKGALLVGPPGTGKTLLAQAVAGEANVPFFSISGSEFVEMFVGMGAARVRDLFKQASDKAPCIVFIDEIDAIGKKRDGNMGGNDEREQTLNQLLTEMDGFDGGKGVVILAATNRPESLDKALLRPGRFDRRVPVELPDLAGRVAILKVHAAKVKTDGEIDFDAVARATSGASGAELANIVNEGALAAVRAGRPAVTQRDLEESVETVIAGYQRKGAVISPREKLIVSYHEIGHALVAAMQKHSAPVHKITIIPRTSGALGYTMQVEEGEKVLMSREEALDKIATLTGGRAAEELIFDSITTGASNDIEQATKIARAMVTRYGMSDNFDVMALETVNNQYLSGDAALICSAETASRVDAEVLRTIREAHEKAREILRQNMEKLHELAKFLLERETITGEEFMEILGAPVKTGEDRQENRETETL